MVITQNSRRTRKCLVCLRTQQKIFFLIFKIFSLTKVVSATFLVLCILFSELNSELLSLKSLVDTLLVGNPAWTRSSVSIITISGEGVLSFLTGIGFFTTIGFLTEMGCSTIFNFGEGVFGFWTGIKNLKNVKSENSTNGKILVWKIIYSDILEISLKS